jgi:ABC-type multidrug transport system ATPase subunit
MCAIALMSKADTVFLDEPCKGFDFQTKQRMINYIKNIDNKSIIYATTVSAEAEGINEQILILN